MLLKVVSKTLLLSLLISYVNLALSAKDKKRNLNTETITPNLASNETSVDLESVEVHSAYNQGLELIRSALKDSSNSGKDISQILVEIDPFFDSCPFKSGLICDKTYKYSNFNGSCNNLNNPTFGMAFTPYKRLLEPEYEDGFDALKTTSKDTGNVLPDPRVISRSIQKDNDKLENIWTNIFTIFGQFITHDMTEVIITKDENGHSLECGCDDSNPECAPILLDKKDLMGIPCMRFVRSSPSFRTVECNLGVREQLNHHSSYLDGSQIYGSSKEENDKLRSFIGGKLKSSESTSGSYLPQSSTTICSDKSSANKCFIAGDSRTSENLGLVGLHTLFMREHNRIADTLASFNKAWDDEKLFMESRRIVVAIYQHIIYSGYIPSLINPDDESLVDILPKNDGFSSYDSTINAQLTNEFAAAAMRFGHTLVKSIQSRYNTKNEPIDNASLNFDKINFKIDEAFNPEMGGVESIFMGLVNDQCGKFDQSISKFLQNSLMDNSRSTAPIDLAAINIKRGRDHGLPSYIKYVEKCSGKTITSFDDLSDIISNKKKLDKLKAVYSNVADIDLWIGGLSETAEHRKTVFGPTFKCLIANQFLELKKGDRFFYENEPNETTGTMNSAFNVEQIVEIKKSSLASLICNNFEIPDIQSDVFFTIDTKLKGGRNPVINSKVPCSTFLKMDLSKWIE